MTKKLEIYISDLTEKAQEEVENFYGDDNNFDLFPICVLEKEEQEDGR